MEFVHEDSVVVLAACVTASTGVPSVLADTAVAGGDMAAFLAVLVEMGRLQREGSHAQFRKGVNR